MSLKKQFITLVLVVGLSPITLAQFNFKESSQELSVSVEKACSVKLKFDLQDYEYSGDEANLYTNSHFEGCSIIASQLAMACEKHPKNAAALKRLEKVICQRASFGERKMILRKNGELVYLNGRNPKEDSQSRTTLIENDLTRLLKIDFQADFKTEVEKDKIQAREAEEAKAQLESEKKQEAQTKKLNDNMQSLTAWYQSELQKIMANPSAPDFAKKIEELTKKFEEKQNALQKN